MTARSAARSAVRAPRRVLVITGSRSEFGLLRPVMQAIRKHRKLRLLVAVAGEHLLAPANTWKEVAAEFRIDARIPMQRRADRTRLDHAAATARGMSGFAAAYKKLKPDWVVVLGDRVEAFAAASAASIAGVAVCHIHGGDRAEGIADEAMRHAITKLAHLHCAATQTSAGRIIAMGESQATVSITGSPAIDNLRSIKPMTDIEVAQVGVMRKPGHWKEPSQVLLMHPEGTSSDPCSAVRRLRVLLECGCLSSRMLAFMPNHDPEREHLVEFLRHKFLQAHWRLVEHLPRPRFIGLLKWMAKHHVPIVGNSSTGLIECAALGVLALDIGPRQAGRERDSNVIHLEGDGSDPAPPDAKPNAHFRPGGGISIVSPWTARLREHAMGLLPSERFGDGRASPRIAALLAKTDPHDPALLRKRNSY